MNNSHKTAATNAKHTRVDKGSTPLSLTRTNKLPLDSRGRQTDCQGRTCLAGTGPTRWAYRKKTQPRTETHTSTPPH